MGLSNSLLWRASRLAEGDDWFAQRVEAACWGAGADYSAEVRRRVALDPDVNGAAQIADDGTVDSSTVPDAPIVAAVERIWEEVKRRAEDTENVAQGSVAAVDAVPGA